MSQKFGMKIYYYLLIGGKFISKKHSLQDLLSGLNAVISTNESPQVITGHVIYNPAYTYK